MGVVPGDHVVVGVVELLVMDVEDVLLILVEVSKLSVVVEVTAVGGSVGGC